MGVPLLSLLHRIKKFFLRWQKDGKRNRVNHTGSDYIVNDIFISHDLGQDDFYRVDSVMPQSIRITNLRTTEWFFASPGLIKNHIGKKRYCELCNKKSTFLLGGKGARG